MMTLRSNAPSRNTTGVAQATVADTTAAITHVARSPRRRVGCTLVAGALLLACVSMADGAITTPMCLAKKLAAWGKLRKCQAGENGRALRGEPADPARCKTQLDAKLAGLSAQATASGMACRYGVNGDGTATDYDTGLQWEQKDNLDDTPDSADPHDADNIYTWSGITLGPPDGTAFTTFLGALNDCPASDGTTVTGGFAGHCDWRLPSIVELTGIFDMEAPGCFVFFPVVSPCIDQTVFGPTKPFNYWSATTFAGNTEGALSPTFLNGELDSVAKDDPLPVRAVRSAL